MFDEQFKLVQSSSGAEQVGNNEEVKTYVSPALPIHKNGYLYVYVSNETPNIDVFFDNLQVKHLRSPLVEETHYYPFGLTMAGISSRSLGFGGSENRRKYNGGSEVQSKEFSDGSGLEMYDTHFRQLDPQLGRWWQIDPKPNDGESLYAAMGNNPILHSDLLGDTLGPVGTFFYNLFHGNKGDGDQYGSMRSATRNEFETSPISATLKDAGWIIGEITQLNAIDNNSAAIADPNVSTGQKVNATIGIILTGPLGENPGGNNPKVHSVYNDGVPVFEGSQPVRLGEPKANPEANGSPHTQLRIDETNNRIYQAREFNTNGKPVRDIDFTTPTYPNGKLRPGHTAPEQHVWKENPTGGSMIRGKGSPLSIFDASQYFK